MAANVGSAHSALPVYAKSAPPPRYSTSPLSDEQTLQYPSRSTSYAAPSGTYRKRKKGIALVLTEQEDDALHPVYDGHSSISGVISLDSRKHISQVKIKVTVLTTL